MMIKLMDILIDTNSELLAESGYEYVIRNKKKIRRKKRKSGYKVVGGKYKKMPVAEKMHRKIAQRKAGKKRRAKKAQINRKRRISMNKRKTLGIKRR
jgi:hypothetical protein